MVTLNIQIILDFLSEVLCLALAVTVLLLPYAWLLGWIQNSDDLRLLVDFY